MTYEFRSSDLDFALFLADLTPAQVIPERWHEDHPQLMTTREFTPHLVALESLVSPIMVALKDQMRQQRDTHRTKAKEAA